MQLAIRAETGDGLQVLTGRAHPSCEVHTVPTIAVYDTGAMDVCESFLTL